MGIGLVRTHTVRGRYMSWDRTCGSNYSSALTNQSSKALIYYKKLCNETSKTLADDGTQELQ